jgi:hypothetical protein
LDGILGVQEAKKVKKMVGSTPALTTRHKENTVAAINELDSTLKLLLPSPPPDLSSKTLTMTGTDCLLSYNVPDNTNGHKPLPASTVKTTRTLQPETTTITSFGSGRSGSLSVELNGTQKGNKSLTLGSDVGTYGELVISRDQAFPLATPGFYEDLDAKYKSISNMSYGYNEIQMKHTETGSTNKVGFVTDVVTTPSVSNIGITETTCVPAYSSGIKHYGSGSILSISATLNGTVSHVYGSSIAQITGSGLGGVSYNIADLNVTTPTNGLTVNLSKSITLNQSFVGLATYSVIAKHPLASQGSQSTNNNILVKIGGGGIDESRRVSTTNTDFPNENPTSPSFDSSLPLNPWEAKIVGGILKHDKTNYTTYMPSGVDYSTHNTAQYINLVLPLGSVGNGKANAQINITGTFTNLWIKLPGKTGWLNTQGSYLGIPPRNNGDPCNDGASNQNPHVTFAGLTTADCNYVVVLRFKLVAGQTISSIIIS